MKLRRLVRRFTSSADFTFISTFGEFWAWSIGLSAAMLVLGAIAALALWRHVLDPLCLW